MMKKEHFKQKLLLWPQVVFNVIQKNMSPYGTECVFGMSK